jgi:hypothetical protein
MYNLPATVDVPVTIQQTSQMIVRQNRPRTLIESMYNLPATDSVLHNVGSANRERAEAILPQEVFHTPIQSTYNLPATTQPISADLMPQETDISVPQEMDIYIPQETDISMLQEMDIYMPQEPDIYMPDSITQLPDRTPQPEMTRQLQQTSENPQYTSAVSPIAIDERVPAFNPAITVQGPKNNNRFDRARPYHFVEYNGKILASKIVHELENYLKQHKQWYLFGGTSIYQGFIISPDKRAWYIRRYPTWTFVFVPRKHGEIRKREGAKLVETFVTGEKRNNRRRSSLSSINPDSFTDAPQHLNDSVTALVHRNLQGFNKIEASIHSQFDEQPLSQLNYGLLLSTQVASLDRRNDTEKDDAPNRQGPGIDLGSFTNPIRRYAGRNLLTAEKDLRDIIKPKPRPSLISFLLYESPDGWELSELQRQSVPHMVQAIAACYYAFTFDRSRESLREIAIDIRLPEKAEAFDLWIVPKGWRAQFLAHRGRSFDDHFLEHNDEASFEAGTEQDAGRASLFEDSESDFHQEISIWKRSQAQGQGPLAKRLTHRRLQVMMQTK